MDNKQKKDKKGYEKIKEEEWIEMQDLNIKKNEIMARKFAQQQKRQFVQNNQGEIKKNNYVYQDNSKESQPKENISNNAYQNTQGLEKKQARRTKKPSIPMMQVLCNYCTLMQNVPGNTQVYICGSCQNMNQCEPLYGVFVCGCCQSKVFYGFGINQYVKCPKCKTVNKVPFQPSKKYISDEIPKPKPRPQQKQEVPLLSEQIIIQKPSENLQNQDLLNLQEINEESQFHYPGI